MVLEDVKNLAQKDLEGQKKAESLTKREEQIFLKVIDTLERYARDLKGELSIGDAAFDKVRKFFAHETEEREIYLEQTGAPLTHVFDFMEAAFGESQEMVAFITELNANYYSVWFIKENGCDQYYRYNKGLLFDNRQQEILSQIDEAEELLNMGIK